MTGPASWAERLNPALSGLSPYTPATGEFKVRLDANEAPNLLSDGTRQRLGEVLRGIEWHRYPDATASELRTAIARRCQVQPQQTLVGVGSDEIISMLLRAFGRDSQSGCFVLTLSPTFVMYRMAAKIHGHEVMEVPLDDSWDMNPVSVSKALEMARPSLIFIASPNNPTGTMVSHDRLVRVIEQAPESIVVIDEAYIDYASKNHLELLSQYDNVVLLRTLSKVGFAALRLGWMLARPELIQEIDKVRLPYNVPIPTQALATVVVSEFGDELARIRDSVVAERERVASTLMKLPGVTVTPSEANFLWLKTNQPAEEVYEGLKARDVLVRSFHKSGGRLKHCLRVTIGLPDENDSFLAALGELL